MKKGVKSTIYSLWLPHLLFWLTAAEPPPSCFGIPHVKFAKACVKFSRVFIKKDHTRGCVALEFKTPHAETDIPLGCFFFRREEGGGLDKGTFLDSDSLMLRLEDLFRDALVCFDMNHLSYIFSKEQTTILESIKQLMKLPIRLPSHLCWS